MTKIKEKIEWHSGRSKLKDLIPNPENPKFLSDKAAERLQDSLESFGQFQPFVVNSDGYSAIDGHQRLNAWIAEKGEDFEVETRIPSRELTNAEVRKLILYSGKGTHGEFDVEMLNEHFLTDDLVNFGGFTLEDLGLDAIDADFDAGSESDQSTLDSIDPKLVTCPHCSTEFDAREHESN